MKIEKNTIISLFSDIEGIKSALKKIKSTMWDMNSYGNPFASFQTVDTYFSPDDSKYTPEYFLPDGGATPLERFALLRHGFGIWIYNLTSHSIIIEYDRKPFIEIPYMDVKEILISDKVEILYNSGVKVPFEEGENTIYIVPDSVYWKLRRNGIIKKGIIPEGVFVNGIMKAEEMGIIELDGKEIRIYDLFGIPIVNVTKHPLSFKHPDTGEEVEVPPSGFVVNAISREVVIKKERGVQFVKTEFVKDANTEELIDRIREKTDAILVGSIIAAQAYKGKVVAMTPTPGYERAKPQEKRMNPKKFTIFI